MDYTRNWSRSTQLHRSNELVRTLKKSRCTTQLIDYITPNLTTDWLLQEAIGCRSSAQTHVSPRWPSLADGWANLPNLFTGA